MIIETHLLFSIILLLWAGMVLGISCLEAWVKFKAATLTKAVGLDVGRTVFRAFHTAQWGMLSILVLITLFDITDIIYWGIIAIAGLLLSLQTTWIFPQLCKNVERIIANQDPIKGSHHAIYACLEMLKLLLLLIGGIYLI